MPYNAFISYSHAADGRLAPAVQSSLHRFARPWYRRRALRVFRDKTSLSATPELWGTIENALSSSEYFLLLASPEAAQSHWVAKEVQWWLDNKSTAKLLICVTEGQVNWSNTSGDFDWSQTTALPQTLQGAFSQEPLYVDLSWARRSEHLSLHDARFREAITLLAATIHGRPMDEMAGEDVRRHRQTKQVASAAIFAILTFAILAAVQWRAAVVERDNAVALVGRLNVNNGLQLAAQDDDFGAVSWFVQAFRRDSDNSARADQHRIRLGLYARALPRVLHSWVQRLPVTDAEFSPDGRWLVTASGESYPRTETEGEARVWDVLSGEPVSPPLPHAGTVYSACFSPDGRRVLTAGGDGAARIWDARTGELLLDAIKPGGVLRLARFDPSGRRVATAGAAAEVWDANTGESITGPLDLPDKSAWHVEFSPDGKKLLVTYGSSYLEGGASARLWDTDTGEPLTPRIGRFGRWVYSAAFSPDGTRFVLADAGGEAQVYATDTGEPVDTPSKHKGTVTFARFRTDNRHLITASEDGGIQLYPRSSDKEWTLEDGILQAALSPDQRLLMTAAHNGGARVWDILNRKALSPVLQFSRTDYPSGKLFEPGETPGPEFAVDFAPDGRRLVTTAWDGTVRIWDLTEVVTQSLSLPKPLATLAVLPKSADPVTIKREQDGVQVKELASSRQTRFEIARPQPNTDGPAQEQFQYRYSDDGKWLAVANTSILTPGWLVVIDTASFKPRRLQTEHPGSIRDFVFGPRGQRLFVIFGSDYFHQRRATSQKDVAPGYVRAWDPHTGQPMTPAFAESRRVSAIQFDRDGERLIGSWDKGVRVWNTRTGKTVSPVMRQQAVITAIVVSPDGRTIAIGNSDNTARLWNADSGETMTPPFRHGPALKSFIPPSVMVALSADANLLATAGSDRMVRIWNSQTAQPMGPKLSIGFVPTDIRFDPDQNSLYVSGKGGAEHSFDIAPMGGKLDELALLAQKLSMREFDKTDVLVYQTNQQMEDQVKRVKALPALGMVPTSEQILNWHKSRLAANPSDPVSIRFHREQILLIEPDEPDWYLQRAADRLWSNQTKQAIADYTKALELGAEGFQPWVGLAVAHVMNQALPEAAKAFTSAIERGDGSDATLLTQLLVQLAIGDVQGYRDTEARLIRSAPQHGTGSLMREQIMRAMAIRIYAGQDCHHALAFIQAKGGKATVYGAADAYCRKDFETARTYLKEQIHKKIHNQPAAEAFMLSMVNQRLGDERAAKGWFTRGIRWHTEWSNTQRLKRDSLSGFLTQLNPALMAAPLLELTVLRNSAAALIGREKADSTD